MSEDRALVQYGLRPDQEVFVATYVQTGNVDVSAKAAGRRVSTAREWMRNPKVQQAIQRELQNKLSGGAMGALDKLIELVHSSGDEKVQLSAAKDLLDRAGYKPEHMHTTADKRMEGASMKEMMARITELQNELGMGSGQTIDVTPTSGDSEVPPPEPPQPGDDDVPEPPPPVEPQNAPQPPAKQKTVEQETPQGQEPPKEIQRDVDDMDELDMFLHDEVADEDLI